MKQRFLRVLLFMIFTHCFSAFSEGTYGWDEEEVPATEKEEKISSDSLGKTINSFNSKDQKGPHVKTNRTKVKLDQKKYLNKKKILFFSFFLTSASFAYIGKKQVDKSEEKLAYYHSIRKQGRLDKEWDSFLKEQKKGRGSYMVSAWFFSASLISLTF